MKKSFLAWLPVVAWCSLIFYLSGIPNLKTEFGFGDLILRKCAHVTEYAILYLLTLRALTLQLPDMSMKKRMAAVFLFTVAYAASDEFHQSFVPTRGPSVMDVLIDFVGASCGMLAQNRFFSRLTPQRVAA